MSFQTKVLVTCFCIVAFDAVASLLSRIFEFEYIHFIWFSFILYVVIGFWGAFRQGFGYGMLLGTIAGFTDSTIGSFVSWLIGPFIQPKMPPLAVALVAFVIVTVTASGFALGSLGAVLCALLKQTRPADA
jgi:hypothetical protein